MSYDPALIGWLVSSLLLSLRIAPLFAFAPPFSLIPAPTVFRALLGVGLAACLAAGHPEATRLPNFGLATLAGAAVKELMLGVVFVLAFQLPYAAIQLAGRTIDIQAGFGFAGVIDPQTKGQSPLAGTILGYAAGAVFFALNGHLDLLRILGASLEAAPLGAALPAESLGPMMSFISLTFITGLGAGAFVILALFLVDLAIVMLSRTAPQMNVLVLGFQVKTVIFLLAMPISLGASGAVLGRLMRYALEGLPRLI